MLVHAGKYRKTN